MTSEAEEDGKKSLLTLCFDRENGKELWRHDFGFGVNQRTHEKSNLAVNTPAVTEDAVYVAFGNADIARYSHDGELIWVKRYIPTFGDPKMAWGYGLSPVVLDDVILFSWDHHTGPCFLIGLDKQTGEIAWRKNRPIGTAHATPLLVEHHGQTDILVPGKNRLTAFDAHTHEQLWQYGEGAIQRRDHRQSRIRGRNSIPAIVAAEPNPRCSVDGRREASRYATGCLTFGTAQTRDRVSASTAGTC